MQCGQGNILDLIREGRYLNLSNQIAGTKKYQKLNINTFLMQKLRVFLNDDTIFYIPKSSTEIISTLK